MHRCFWKEILKENNLFVQWEMYHWNGIEIYYRFILSFFDHFPLKYFSNFSFWSLSFFSFMSFSFDFFKNFISWAFSFWSFSYQGHFHGHRSFFFGFNASVSASIGAFSVDPIVETCDVDMMLIVDECNSS